MVTRPKASRCVARTSSTCLADSAASLYADSREEPSASMVQWITARSGKERASALPITITSVSIETTAKVRCSVKILYAGNAHLLQPPLKRVQIIPAQHLLLNIRAPRHGKASLSFSPFLRSAAMNGRGV